LEAFVANRVLGLVYVPASQYTLYPVTKDPPSVAGAFHDIVIDEEVGVTDVLRYKRRGSDGREPAITFCS